MNILRIIILIIPFFTFISNCALANWTENEMPMYGRSQSSLSDVGEDKSENEEKQDRERSKELSAIGWKYFYAGDSKTAIKRFNQAWLLYPKNPSVWWGFGVIMGKRGEEKKEEKFFLESIEFLEKALVFDEKNNRIMLDISVTYTKLGSFQYSTTKASSKESFVKALDWLKKAETINSADVLLWLSKAHTEYIMGLFGDATLSYIKAIELDSKNIEAHNDYAWLLATCPETKYRNATKALELAQIAVSLGPNIPGVYDTLAASYAEKGEFEKAVHWQEKAIKLQDENENTVARKESVKRLGNYIQGKPWRDHMLTWDKN